MQAQVRGSRVEGAQGQDRRIVRTREALRGALADEIIATADLSRVTVTSLCERAGVTRRTFYSHYKDIPDLVLATEKELLQAMVPYLEAVSGATLAELEAAVSRCEAAPGSVELVRYLRAESHVLWALLGHGGDPAFLEQVVELVRAVVAPRALKGLDLQVAGPLFDYYLAYTVSAEVGVLVRWLARGARESEELMARVMTMLVFVRPGDLYGKQLAFDPQSFGAALLDLTLEEQHGQD